MDAEAESARNPGLVLVTGATGYVGGRLVNRLAEQGIRLRLMVRRPAQMQGRAPDGAEVVAGDVFEPASLERALKGVSVAYYLIHSMGGEGDFEARDREAATNFATAAKSCGVKRIIYLGGLGSEEGELSAHLRSRQETGRLLKDSGAEVIEFRAGVVLGSGSISFEMIRALVERLPVMITPRWVRVRTQPIGIRDLISYLAAAATVQAGKSRVYEIGGAETLTYGGIMDAYATARGLRRLLIPVPFLTPRLSSLWLGLVTPVYARVGRKLFTSIVNETVANDVAARRDFPDIEPMSAKDAIRLALRREHERTVETRWCDSLSALGPRRRIDTERLGPRLVDNRSRYVHARPALAFLPMRRIGGRRGWYAAQWLWELRGFMDLFVGGAGLRRGRRHPDDLRVGDVLDFWRVEAIEPDRRLVLVAEMRLPGRAWLEFQVKPEGEGSRISLSAIFDPLGVLGRVYWTAVMPLHHHVFSGMLRSMARHAERAERRLAGS